MSTIWSSSSHSVVSSGGVTITSVNVEVDVHSDNATDPQFRGKSIPVASSSSSRDMETGESDLDVEVSQIDFSGVTMRTCGSSNNNKRHGEGYREHIERPMSWEGELSDSEIKKESSGSQYEDENGASDLSIKLGNATGVDQHYVKFKSKGTSDSKCSDDTAVGSCQYAQELPSSLIDKLSRNAYAALHVSKQIAPTASPDSAIHSCYSPTQSSPVASRHLPSSGFSSPFTPPSLSRNNSDASQYGGSQHSSCYSQQSFSSVSASPTQFSPTNSPLQIRHNYRNSDQFGCTRANRHLIEENLCTYGDTSDHSEDANFYEERNAIPLSVTDQQSTNLSASSGISRQQLINSPCPICGDKISGFHYGIFSCESCKGFFKRTVQNHKNYVCLRGSSCLVTIATRKKCPACRFDKCLNMGMKLEAIRVDRTRGGRSTYPFSYTLPASLMQQMQNSTCSSDQFSSDAIKKETTDLSSFQNRIPPLLQEIMEVEHLWRYNESDTLNMKPQHTNNAGTSELSNLCKIADHRLYKIVKWCKSLPLFKNISIDDQISLLINSWCELLLFSCCYRSITSPGEIRVSRGKSITLSRSKELGLSPCIERMLNFTDHLRRLRVDRYEYVAMKVIVLLSSDSSGLREPEKARGLQEKALQALQQYTVIHYPEIPSKFGELLLRIPDLQRTCQVHKEMLSLKQQECDGEERGFNLLMELLRGDH